jgi:hypothetical protein
MADRSWLMVNKPAGLQAGKQYKKLPVDFDDRE